MLIAVTIFSFATIFSFILALFFLFTAQKRQIISRMKQISRSPGQIIVDNNASLPKEKIRIKNFLKILGKIFETQNFSKRIERNLLKADIPMRGGEFVVFNILTLLIGILGGYLIGNIGPAIVLGILGLLIPNIYVMHKKRLRYNTLNQQIGDCLTIMSNALRAGFSFQQAMDLVGKEMNGPLADEFRKTLREINFGTPTEQALANMAARTASDDLDLMITAVLIQRQIGGNLAEILDNISNTLRERIRIKGEIKTLTAQGRISGIIIGLLPPILFGVLLLVNPTYISLLLQKKLGIFILISGVFSEVVGVLIIRKIVSIEV